MIFKSIKWYNQNQIVVAGVEKQGQYSIWVFKYYLRNSLSLYRSPGRIFSWMFSFFVKVLIFCPFPSLISDGVRFLLGSDNISYHNSCIGYHHSYDDYHHLNYHHIINFALRWKIFNIILVVVFIIRFRVSIIWSADCIWKRSL